MLYMVGTPEDRFSCVVAHIRLALFERLSVPISCRKRVFILGPSHHVRLSGCALTGTERYRTPFYDLIVDTKGIVVKISEEIQCSS